MVFGYSNTSMILSIWIGFLLVPITEYDAIQRYAEIELNPSKTEPII